MPCRPSRSFSISTPPTTRCTASRRGGRQLRCQLHGYYGGYCYLPLDVFGGDQLLAAIGLCPIPGGMSAELTGRRRSRGDASAGAVAEVARIVGQVRARWPEVRIILRADSGFAREALMAWCDNHQIDYVLGLARNPRLVREIAAELALAEIRGGTDRQGRPLLQGLPLPDPRQLEPRTARRRQSRAAGRGWRSAERQPALRRDQPQRRGLGAVQPLYEQLYCARGEPPRCS